MAEPLRHRQTKEAATDMFSLQPPRHISTLPFSTIWAGIVRWLTSASAHKRRSGAGPRRCTRPDRRDSNSKTGDRIMRYELADRAIAATRSDRKSTRLNSSHGYVSYAVF